jgi:sugar phosphate permease
MDYSPYWASQALALTQGGAMVGRIGWGVVSDRLFGGRRKIVLILIGAVSVIWFIALSFMDRDSSSVVLMSVLFLAGVSIVGYQGVSYALIGEISGKTKTGAGLGMMITINAAGATIGTPIFGYIVDRTGSYAPAWQFLAAAITIGMVAMGILLKEPRRG